MAKVSSKNIFLIACAVVVIIAVNAAVYFYMQYAQANQLLKNPTLVAQQQTTQLVMQVSKLMELPTGEQPTVATVSDVSKLKDQAFFQNAQNGDKVLIYTKARKAILYRPSANKIIDVAPVNLGANDVTVTPAPSVAPVVPTTRPLLPTTAPIVSPTPAQ